jgi:membrane fusion protein (multidrug efflux system)
MNSLAQGQLIELRRTVETPKTAPAETDGSDTPVKNGRNRFPLNLRKLTTVGVLVLSLGTVGYFGWQWLQDATSHEETDDAYITGHLHQVSSRINGTVETVLVDDNDHVKAGQVLATLDPRDYRVKLEQSLADLRTAQQQARVASTTVRYTDSTASGQDTSARGGIENARAAIAAAEASVREATANIQSAKANLAAKEAEEARAEADWQRYDKLERQGAVTTSQKDAAKRDYLVAVESSKSARELIRQSEAKREQAQQAINTAQAQLTQSQGQLQLAKATSVQTFVNKDQYAAALAAVQRAQTAVDEAKLNLSYTKIVAPTAGRIGKKTIEEGMRIEPGQPLLTIVSDNPWVVANYKETQLKKMNAGQEVEITIDSVPGHKFTGRVQSFSPASGASFAVLPSDNATGNFTKIVQRVPVKILFDDASTKEYADRLTPGMSVITKVDVTHTHHS